MMQMMPPALEINQMLSDSTISVLDTALNLAYQRIIRDMPFYPGQG
jgi:hypothetical protein